MQLSTLGERISFRWLLGIYLFVPFLFLVWLSDVLFFDSSLLPYMGMATLLLPIYLLLFEMPHIISSLLTFVDRSYVSFYSTHLLIGIPIMVAVVLALFQYDPTLAFLLYVMATAYHAIRQQTGIASLLAKAKGLSFQIWSAAMIVSTALTWALLATPQIFTRQEVVWFSVLVFVSVVVSCLSGILYWRQAQTKIGRQYIIATTLMILVAYIFIRAGYIFFAFFVIRFIHDVTAFTFYVVHDHNRNQKTTENIFYSIFKKIKVPFFISVPLIGIGIALILQLGIGNTSTLAIAVLATLGFIHYYLESIMWKRDSIHRQHISFSGALD